MNKKISDKKSSICNFCLKNKKIVNSHIVPRFFMKKLNNEQHIFFNREWENKWSKYFFNRDDLKDKIIKLKYDNFSDVNRAFGKLDKALQICNFLHKLSKSKPPQDTEKIIITIFVSCAEAVYRINKPNESMSENLIKGFFKPVKSDINHKIRGHVEKLPNLPYEKVFDAVEILYLLRNDYIHNGNFIGIFFRDDNVENCIYNIGNFDFSETKNKTKLISAESECCLTYKQFLTIFLKAFIKNIEKYINKKS